MALAPLLAALAAADALGAWTANGARLELKDEGGKVVGRLAAEGGPCAVKPGTELIKGTLLDDSLSAQVRLCLIAQQCGPAEDTALAVLLVTRTLTGGVHTRAACAQEVRSLVLRRPGGGAMAMAAPAANQRLSKTPPPRAPRAPAPAGTTQIADNTKINTGAIGEIPNRPVGDPAHPPGYDPRDARKAGTPRGEADQLLVEGAALLQQGKFEQARKSFHGAMEKDPQRAESSNG